jgi:predicted transcriptional regulator
MVYNDVMQPTRHVYEQLGFKTIPITYGKKSSPPQGWNTTDSDVLWSTAPAKCNMGLQAGVSGMFLLDPDTEQGSVYVKSYLDSLGIKAWNVKTWRGFLHHWVKTTMPTNIQWNGKLKDNMGDWRGRNGYGLAAPSYIHTDTGDGVYSLPYTNPHEVPFMEWSDIQPLLNARVAVKIDPTKLSLPVPVLRRKLPHWAYTTAKQIAEMGDPGRIHIGAHVWESRSEAVMSVLMTSLLNGHSQRMVMKWCGSYREEKWWLLSTAKAVQYIVDAGERPQLERMYNSAFDLNKKDEDVFRAILSVLWYVGSHEGHVSNRDIQLLVARGRQSVSSSVGRLIRAGYVSLLEPSDGAKASKYAVDLSVERFTREQSIIDEVHQDVLRHGGLTHNQLALLEALDHDKTPKQLAEVTNLQLSGVYYSLKKLEKYDLVSKNGKKWTRSSLSSDKLNALFDASDSYAKRSSRINTERRLFLSNRG